MFRHKAFSSISFSLSSKVTSTHLKMSADETTGFHGRFGSTQYTPKKPVKWGIKVFTLADANTGYLLNILVHTGAQTLDDADPQFASLPVLTQTVLDLVSSYLGKGHHVFCDRFYSSLPLVQTLQSNRCTTPAKLSKTELVFLMPSDCNSPWGTIQCSSIVSSSWSLRGHQNPRRHQENVLLPPRVFHSQ